MGCMEWCSPPSQGVSLTVGTALRLLAHLEWGKANRALGAAPRKPTPWGCCHQIVSLSTTSVQALCIGKAAAAAAATAAVHVVIPVQRSQAVAAAAGREKEHLIEAVPWCRLPGNEQSLGPRLFQPPLPIPHPRYATGHTTASAVRKTP